MSKDLFNNYLLKLYYETKIDIGRYTIPYEFLYHDELDDLYNSFGFAVFKLRYLIEVFIKKLAEKLKQ